VRGGVSGECDERNRGKNVKVKLKLFTWHWLGEKGREKPNTGPVSIGRGNRRGKLIGDSQEVRQFQMQVEVKKNPRPHTKEGKRKQAKPHHEVKP